MTATQPVRIGDATLYLGDCRERLAELPADSVDCVVMSPPYLGLRDYGIEPVVWGGDAACTHEWDEWTAQSDKREPIQHAKTRTTDRFYGDASRRFDGNHQKHTAGQFCRRCGAWRGSLGLEPTPDLYVEHMVEVMRAVRRVLKPSGTVWFNIGDSYNNFRSQMGPGQAVHGRDDLRGKPAPLDGKRGHAGLKEKDLMMMPARVALALQQGWSRCSGCETERHDNLWPVITGHRICEVCLIAGRRDAKVRPSEPGWWIRSEIVWSKPNPMPESVTDRPTSAHEKIFLLTKSARYWYDADAVREDRQGVTHSRGQKRSPPIERSGNGHEGWCSYMTRDNELQSRNLRNVWDLATQPYPEAHFATFPVKLAERCILAGCPPGGVVLDPFGGAGTVGVAAARLGRTPWLIEISDEYMGLIRKRIEDAYRQGDMFRDVAPERPTATQRSLL